ncbi:hypothetical protein G9F71_014715 [Clostridium sp. FP2]|uniref:hypothetical protein n=1 Tax=Clostridium TaxID=1485 RepID=UPI0013E97976|nr:MULTISPECIES: hypothetical protein [Clostridium]MBW9155944.1 hypothetical protein [Clostridium tagluense]MBZ9624102.1 hypothetical protein [Clostridium sp. FP2]WLC63992.1 hypothetical protein KTC93_14025 [Clostridium tagluense]
MLKTIITRKSDDVVSNIVDTSKVVENGLLVKDSTGEYIIGCMGECNQYNNVETLDIIAPQKYKYTVPEGFIVDQNYKPYISTEMQIIAIQNALKENQNAINSLLKV